MFTLVCVCFHFFLRRNIDNPDIRIVNINLLAFLPVRFDLFVYLNSVNKGIENFGRQLVDSGVTASNGNQLFHIAYGGIGFIYLGGQPFGFLCYFSLFRFIAFGQLEILFVGNLAAYIILIGFTEVTVYFLCPFLAFLKLFLLLIQLVFLVGYAAVNLPFDKRSFKTGAYRTENAVTALIPTAPKPIHEYSVSCTPWCGCCVCIRRNGRNDIRWIHINSF